MSLINQMLQDLDARRSDALGHDAFAQQIRAVQEQRRIHPAWWIALILAFALIGILTWLFLRPPVAPPTSQVKLPLKLDSDLNLKKTEAAQPSVTQNIKEEASATTSIPSEKREESTSVTTVPLSNALALQQMQTSSIASAATAVRSTPSAGTSSKPIVPSPMKDASNPPVPELAKIIPAAKSFASTPASKSVDLTSPGNGNKHIRELTPQQKAENEYRKATLLIQQGRVAEAIGNLEAALQLDAYHAVARQTLIGMLLEQRRLEDALRTAHEGISLDPSQYGLAMIFARLQLEKGNLRSAIETLERSLPYATDQADYQAFLAAMLQRDGRHKQAVEHYLQALNKAPQSGAWWMGLGISLQAERRAPEAQEAFKRAKATNTLSVELSAFIDAQLSQLQR